MLRLVLFGALRVFLFPFFSLLRKKKKTKLSKQSKMSNSRSLAAAKARRSQAQAPNRFSGQAQTQVQKPGMSIRSNAAFSQTQMKPPEPPSNGLPFTKLSISDAIGLITMRLGKVEQYMMELQHKELTEGETCTNSGTNDAPNHSAIFATFSARLDHLEKKEHSDTHTHDHTIKLLKNELLMLQQKLQIFMNETKQSFNDVDYAISTIEKENKDVDVEDMLQIQPSTEDNVNITLNIDGEERETVEAGVVEVEKAVEIVEKKEEKKEEKAGTVEKKEKDKKVVKLNL